MTEWELLEERVISGRGLFVNEYDSLHRIYMLRCKLARLPTWDYPNKKYPREPSLYAYIEWENQGYVQRTDTMRYKQQEFYWNQDVTGQLKRALVCEFQQVNEKLNLIMDALEIPVGPPGDPEFDILYNPLQFPIDRILFECRDDCAVFAELWVYPYDENCPRAESTPVPPPPPPNIPDLPLPPGTPLTPDGGFPVSPPYDGISDDGDTAPFPEDEPSPPPEEYPKGEPCEIWLVELGYNFSAGAIPLVGSSTAPFYGPIYDLPTWSTRTDGNTLVIVVSVDCLGVAIPGFPACGERQIYDLDYVSATEPSSVLGAGIIDVRPQTP